VIEEIGNLAPAAQEDGREQRFSNMTSSARAARVLAGGALVAAALGVFSHSPVQAQAPSCPTLNGTALAPTAGSPTTPPGGHAFIVCTGKVRTFDGTPLHVDVTLPTVPYVPAGSHSAATPPLVMFLSGWSNDVCQFESTSLEGSAVAGCSDFIGAAGYHWNNAWFASQGVVSLNYTPRGWYDSCGKQPQSNYAYATDPKCSDTPGEQSWVHLYDRRFEIRDAQFLAGLLVDAKLVKASQIVTTGDSGGGGPSWDLALSRDQVVTLNSTPGSVHTVPWTSPKGTSLHLAAALPMYTWTDLLDALVSNGRASDHLHGAPADGNHQSPLGVDKLSYVSGFYALGQADAQYAPSPPALNADPTADLNTWFGEVNAGEPYSADPNLPAVVAQIAGPLRSPFAMPVPASNKKPIFAIQGFTDPLFPVMQAQTMINRLKAADSHYPVWAFYGDVGHSYANNPLDVWQQAHNEGNAWLTAVLTGHTPSQPAATATTTRCVSGQTLRTYSGSSFGQLAPSTLNFSSAAVQTTINSKIVTPEGANADPIANAGCRTMAASQSDPNQASYSFVVPSAATILGGPVINVTAAVTGSSAELAARLWDVDASGNQTLITRTAYRIEQAAGTTTLPLSFELSQNAWQLQCGHTIKLELTQDDGPSWRADNEPASIALSNMKLSLPVVPGTVCK